MFSLGMTIYLSRKYEQAKPDDLGLWYWGVHLTNEVHIRPAIPHMRGT